MLTVAFYVNSPKLETTPTPLTRWAYKQTVILTPMECLSVVKQIDLLI